MEMEREMERERERGRGGTKPWGPFTVSRVAGREGESESESESERLSPSASPSLRMHREVAGGAERGERGTRPRAITARMRARGER